MQFKAFLFNIYHVCITAIVWHKHQQNLSNTTVPEESTEAV